MKTVIALCLIALFAVSKGRNIINEEIAETADRTTPSDLTGKTAGIVYLQATTSFNSDQTTVQTIKIVEPETINPIIHNVSTGQPDQTVKPEPTSTSTHVVIVDPETVKPIKPEETTGQPGKIVEPETVKPIKPEETTGQPGKIVEPETVKPIKPEETTGQPGKIVEPETVGLDIKPEETTGQPGKIVEPETINPTIPVVSSGQPDQTAEPEPISTSNPTVVTDQTDNIVVPEPEPTESIKPVITGCPPRSCRHEHLIPTACRKANYFWYNRRRCRACDSNTCRGEFLRVTGHLLNKAILIGRERD